MKKQEILNKLESCFEAIIEEKDVVEDVAKFFLDKIDIPYDCITGVDHVEDFEWCDDYIDFDVVFATKNGQYSIFKEYRLKKEINLKMHVMNAINNFKQWSGNYTFDSAYLKNDVVMICFKEDDIIDVPLKDVFENMRNTLINCMNANCECWKDNNVERWNDYEYYILPVLRVLDEIENGVKLYN